MERRKPVLDAEKASRETHPEDAMPAPEWESTSITEVSQVRGEEGRFAWEFCVLSVSTTPGRGGAAPEESKDKVTDKQEEPPLMKPKHV